MSKLNEIREAAEADLIQFIKLVAPYRVLGSVHEELCRWWNREDAKSHQLTLLPRDHGKSAMVAYRVAWRLTKDPTLRVLYISATSNLAQKQLSFIKQIFESKIFKRYWPNYVNENESEREKWTQTEICLDHPLRKERGIRDPSIITGGLTTSLTGFHCDIAVLDDVVVYENAYTVEGRNRVKAQYSLLSSIEGADAEEWAVGTRYHPNDLYNDMLEMFEDIYSEDGEVIEQIPIYETFERQVEDRGDGSGEFLWPRQQSAHGKWYGFNREVLARKRGQYLDKVQFRAQYYNTPSNPEDRPIDYDKFQYYEQSMLKQRDGQWYYRDKKLNLFAAIDFAFSTKKRADYTAIVVIGVDEDHDVYVLDISRFKTDKISDYYKELLVLINKWDFRKLRAEVTAAQSAIVNELKDNYIKPNGLYLKVDEFRPSRYQGAKEERIAAILEPRYDNLQVYHYRGGNCQSLEEELVSNNPPHDDIKDALAAAIETSVAPTRVRRRHDVQADVLYHPRFGGMRF